MSINNMNNQLFIILKKKLDDLSTRGEVDVETRRNVIKEELQYHALNFIYHHPQYHDWIMYGGSALRICYDLNRMSVDLDFEVKQQLTDVFLNKLKKEIERHFTASYAFAPTAFSVKIVRNRGLLLRFVIGDELSLGHPSKQVHIKIDLNHFAVRKTVIERIPVSYGQLAFVITTYNMSALMASKIAAILRRGKRGVGKAVYEEKGRDIYDLLWYMGKKVIPDLDYLAAKGINVADARTLFDRLTLQINKVNDINLRQDLLPLFVDRAFIENWLKQWRESYLRLVKSYQIHTAIGLLKIGVHQNFRTDNFSLVYFYKTKEGDMLRIVYDMSEYWVEDKEGNLRLPTDDLVAQLMHFEDSIREKHKDKLKQYATLFNRKNKSYLKKTHNVVLGNSIVTKTIRMTADNLDLKEQIVLNRSGLLSCELEDLLK